MGRDRTGRDRLLLINFQLTAIVFLGSILLNK